MCCVSVYVPALANTYAWFLPTYSIFFLHNFPHFVKLQGSRAVVRVSKKILY